MEMMEKTQSMPPQGRLATQYDLCAESFVESTSTFNEISRFAYYARLPTNLQYAKVLDVACGDGFDLAYLKQRGIQGFGIDASSKMTSLARSRSQSPIICQSLMESLPFKDDSFDIVMSKYAIQTSSDAPKVLSEMARVTKPGGILMYLAVHPLRQFLEKKKHPKDYFKQEVVDSILFNGKVTVEEPTHTMNEYLNPDFLKTFEILDFVESHDHPSAEQIDGDTYPCFFIIKARKRFPITDNQCAAST